MSATDRTLILSPATGGSVWLEPMPIATGRIPAWGVTPTAQLRAYGQRGHPAAINAVEARAIATALVEFADLADRTAAGR